MISRYDYNLLVVEDSKLINTTLCDLLSKSFMPRFKIHTAMTLEEARGILEKHPIDFITLDLELPDGSGEELIGYLIISELNNQAKVIVLTGNIEKERRDHLFQLGVIDYLSKDNPINFLANEITKSIAQYVSHKNIHVLVVDDSKFFANHVTAILKNQNYTVYTCLESPKVYGMLKSLPINLVVTDLEMPEMDGIELLREIRKDDEFLDLPIIGLSGTNNQDLISRLLKSGANDFLSKPFTTENLLLKVDISVSLHKKQRKLMELNQYLQEEIARSVEEIRSRDQIMELDNRHAQMGQMVGSLIHQWKQPLHAINLATDYIKNFSAEDEVTIEMVDTIQDQVYFLNDTMNHFRDFFKPAKEQVNFSVLGAFRDVIKMLKDTYVAIDIVLEGDDSLHVLGYPNEFAQVIINLFSNAQDAFVIHQIVKPCIMVNVKHADGNIITTICDNAGGIPDKIIKTLFMQYVSTKGDSGTGIGLHLSRLIITKMNGIIDVENQEDGACFILTLPRVKENL